MERATNSQEIKDKKTYKQTTLGSFFEKKNTNRQSQKQDSQKSNQVANDENCTMFEEAKNDGVFKTTGYYSAKTLEIEEPLVQQTPEEIKEPNHKNTHSKKSYVLPQNNANWPTIKAKLQELTKSSLTPKEFYSTLEFFIYNHFNGKYNQIDTSLLQHVTKNMHSNQSTEFFAEIIPYMADLALEVEILFPNGISMLSQNELGIVYLTKRQSACLLFHMFFCTTVDPNKRILPNACTLASWYSMYRKDEARAEKVKCFLNYVRRIKEDLPKSESEIISFERVTLDPSITYGIEYWKNSTELLTFVMVEQNGGIQDAKGALQIDFANKYIGGGVLTTGCVQEEIMFTVAPEHLLSVLFTEVMLPTEAVIIKGAQEYCRFSGYAFSFKFAGDLRDDKAPLDECFRREIITVAIDAINFSSFEAGKQFANELVLRELNKAFVGFKGSLKDLENDGNKIRPVATGKWGCGVFRGDPQLKFILQWLACSNAKRSMIFYPFGDRSLNDINKITEHYKGKSVGVVFNQLLEIVRNNNKNKLEARLFELLLSYSP